MPHSCYSRAMASACKVHPVEFRRIKALHPTYTTGEILIHFSRCPTWYYEELRANKKKVQDTLTERVCATLGIHTDQPLTYAYLSQLEDFLNINIYAVSARMGSAFSYVSPNKDEERKKVFLYHNDMPSRRLRDFSVAQDSAPTVSNLMKSLTNTVA